MQVNFSCVLVWIIGVRDCIILTQIIQTKTQEKWKTLRLCLHETILRSGYCTFYLALVYASTK